MPAIGFLALILLFAPGADDVDDAIAEFQRFYKGNATVAEKIEAIHVLDRADRPAAVEALLACFDDPDFAVRQAAIDVVGSYKNPECAQFLVDQVVANRRERSAAKRAVAAESLARMGHPLAIEPITALLDEKDENLRLAAIQSLGRLKATAAVPKLAAMLEGADPALRVAVIDALGAIQAADANPAVLAQLSHDQWQVRAAAIQALSRIRAVESVQPLIDRLRAEDGRLREDVTKALLSITTFDLGDDPDKWQRQWDSVKDRFVVPSDAEVAKVREAYEKSRLRYEPGAGDDFAGIPTKSRRIVYVIDQSGSMEDALIDRQRFVLQGRTYKDFVKMEVVKEELGATIEKLDDTVFFNVIAFATKVDRWNERGLVQANILNRKKAAEWVRKLKPIGGASQNLKKKAGLAAAAASELGKTNTYDALMAALDSTSAQAGYDTDFGSPVDTIYFLSDGEPTAGPVTEVDLILDDVRRVNALRKITIHTINIGRNPLGKVLMGRLARDNGGTFLDLGE